MTKSEKIFEEGCLYIPGGVNSPVRAFRSINSTPRMITKADKARMWDEDGNEYIDYVGSFGPMILGHNHPMVYEAVVESAKDGLSFGAATRREVEMAKLICKSIPAIDMIRMVNSGTEAVMSAIRAARGYTKREKMIKFEGCYHGHSDGLLVKAGSGAMTQGTPDSAGVTKGCTKDTLTAAYNDLESVKELFVQFPEEIACVIVEPVAANMGVVVPKEGFLQGLRDLCTQYGALLIFDEVITGFRLEFGGAAQKYQVMPDLITYGKIIGAGMPIGAYGGRRDIMEMIAPVGPVYQAGTLSGNPVAMTAGYEQLIYLKFHPESYEHLNQRADAFFEEMKAILSRKGLCYRVNHVGSIGSVFFTEKDVINYETAKTSDTGIYAKYCLGMLERGIYLAPAQFEAMFLSMAHTKEDLDHTLEIFEEVIGTL